MLLELARTAESVTCGNVEQELFVRDCVKASSRSTNALTLFFLILVLLLNSSFIKSPGTGDVSVSFNWTEQVVAYGPVAGYCKTPSDYPPGSFGVRWAFGSVLTTLVCQENSGFKLRVQFSSKQEQNLTWY